MAFLMDLPPAARRELAAHWGAEETTALLYRAMTDPDRLAERVDGPGRAALARLEREPGSLDELLAALPLSRERLSAAVDVLGTLGLVLREPAGAGLPPRPARAPFGDETLYVPADVAVALPAEAG